MAQKKWWIATVTGGRVGAGKSEPRKVAIWAEDIGKVQDILLTKVRGWKKQRLQPYPSIRLATASDVDQIEQVIRSSNLNPTKIKRSGFLYLNRL